MLTASVNLFRVAPPFWRKLAAATLISGALVEAKAADVAGDFFGRCSRGQEPDLFIANRLELFDRRRRQRQELLLLIRGSSGPMLEPQVLCLARHSAERIALNCVALEATSRAGGWSCENHIDRHHDRHVKWHKSRPKRSVGSLPKIRSALQFNERHLIFSSSARRQLRVASAST